MLYLKCKFTDFRKFAKKCFLLKFSGQAYPIETDWEWPCPVGIEVFLPIWQKGRDQPLFSVFFL